MQIYQKLIPLYKKHSEIISYAFFGGLTTLTNIVSYWILARAFGVDAILATMVAWLISVIFAYITNRIFVFKSRKTGFIAICIELSLFIACRIFSGLVDIAIMYVFVKQMLLYDILIKILSNIIVIVLNFVLSKMLIFKKNNRNNKDNSDHLS